MKDPNPSRKQSSPTAEVRESSTETPNILSPSRTLFLILLFAVGALLSGLLFLDHYGVSGAHSAVSQVCGEDDVSGCEQVAKSPYSSLGGLSVAGIGLLFYGSAMLLLFISFPANAELKTRVGSLLFGLMALALALDVVLLGLQTFSIGAYCRLCLATYAVNLAAFAIVLPAKSGLPQVVEFFRDGPGKPTAAAWGLGSLALFVLIGTADYVMGPQSPAEADFFGASAAGESTSSAASGSAPTASGETDAASSEGSLSSEEMREQLRQLQVQNKLLQRIIDDPNKYREYRTAKALEDFKQAGERDLDLTSVPAKGPEAAPIRVVEFSDFLCPYCRSFAGGINRLMPRWEGRVRVFFKNYPLDQDCNPGLKRTIHPGACQLALGGICAQEQTRFWVYHDKIFSKPPENPSMADVVRLAAEIGLNRDQFWACMGSGATREKLEKQIQEAKRLEVKSTPTVFVNGKKLPRPDVLLKAIEEETKDL